MSCAPSFLKLNRYRSSPFLIKLLLCRKSYIFAIMSLALYPYELVLLLVGEQVKQIRNDAFVHPQSIYKTIDELWDGEI